jgi:hypothetical protein
MFRNCAHTLIKMEKGVITTYVHDIDEAGDYTTTSNIG